jgi:AsmA protein
MRLSVKLTIALAAGLALLAGFYRWPIASTRVDAEFNRATPPIGLHWRGPARATLTLLPWPTLRVVGVDLLEADGRSLLAAPTGRFPLSLAGLLHGRFAPTGAMLDSPTALFDLDAAPALAEERAVAADTGEESVGAWSSVRLHGGVLRVVSASRHLDTLIENLEGALAWRRADSPLRFALTGAWRGQSVSINGRVDSPRDALHNRATGVGVSIVSTPFALAANGQWGGEGAPGFVGRLSIDIRSLAAATRLLGGEASPFPLGDAFMLSGDVQSAGDALTLSKAKVTATGQQLNGALTLDRRDGRYAISGTLAADKLDLAALAGPQPDPLTSAGEWSDQPFAFAPPRDIDLDLRLSATRLAWRDHGVDDAAGSLMCRLGRCTAALLEASAYQGALKGELRLARVARGLEAQATLSLTDADLGAAFTDFGWSGYHGHGDVEATLKSTGFAASDSVLSLSGEASATLKAGAVDGVSVEEAMRRSLRRPVDVARDLGNGATRFSLAKLRLSLAAGSATIEEGHVEGPGSTIDLSGTIDIAARTIEARALATQSDAQGAPSPNAAQLTIMLFGPWSAPNVATSPGG